MAKLTRPILILVATLMVVFIVLIIWVDVSGIRVRYRERITLVRPPPLFKAIEDGKDISVVTSLLDRDPGLINQKVNGASALHEATTFQRIDAVKLLLKRGADVNATVDPPNFQSSMTPLVIAVVLKNTDLAKILIDAGADLNVKSIWGQSMLELARSNHDNEMVRILQDAARNRRSSTQASGFNHVD